MNLRLAYHPEGGRTLEELQNGIVRLAYNPGPVNAYKALSPPSVRLAYGNSPPERNGTSGLEANARSVRLAVAPHSKKGGANSVEHHVGKGGLGKTREAGQEPNECLALGGTHSQDKVMAMEDRATAPALLVSYVYLEPFLKHRERYYYRDWVLDSGAFSAHNSGTEIVLQDYIDCCKKLLLEDQTLTEVFALDVIGDWKASLKNCEEMWKQGVPAIPCYHYGEPEHVLLTLAREYDKIAIGGAVGVHAKVKNKFAEQCFARIWPKRVHGFGFGSEASILLVPFHSVDATNWESGPCRFGRWNSFGVMSVRGSRQNLRAEVEFYLKLEQRARQKWAKEMRELETLTPSERLACDASAVSGQRIEEALAPQVRLAEQQANPAQSAVLD